jgi:hypothetical protein
MAVMLRTLGIPARVAVGFTPGTINPDDPTLWTVTWANAHAWVEVKFGGEWIAFEPTPRADGNVLVPSVRDLTPAMTAQDPQTTGETLAPPPGTNDPQFDIFDEREALQNRDPRAAQNDLATGGGTQVSRRLTDPTLIVFVGVLVVAALALLVLIGRRQTAATGPRSRILSVREQIGRLGHGLGVPPPAWETDTEYLTRLGGDSAAGTVLADACTHARYAPEVSVAVAERAEQAGMELTRALVAERPRWQRSLIRVRGDLVAGWRRLRRRG